MNTQDSKAVPELLEKSVLRSLREDELRAKALKVLSKKSHWSTQLILALGLGTVFYFVPQMINSSGLHLTELERAILFGLSTAIPALIAQVWNLERRLDAAIQLLQSSEE